MSDDSTAFAVEFYRDYEAFPGLFRVLPNHDEGIMVMVSSKDPAVEEATLPYEFRLTYVGSASGPPIGLRAEIFGDAWRAFADLPQFFALLSELHDDGKTVATFSHLDLGALLVERLGWSDVTEKLRRESQHNISSWSTRFDAATASLTTNPATGGTDA